MLFDLFRYSNVLFHPKSSTMKEKLKRKKMRRGTVRSALAQRDMTQSDLANAVNVTPTAISLWINGHVDSPDLSKRIAQILRINTEDLVNAEG